MIFDLLAIPQYLGYLERLKKILYFKIIKSKFNSESHINFSIIILKVTNFIKKKKPIL